MASIQQVAADYKTASNAAVSRAGHTNTAGLPECNMTLSRRRADAVRDALVREGVPATAISAGAQGEASCLSRPATMSTNGTAVASTSPSSAKWFAMA